MIQLTVEMRLNKNKIKFTIFLLYVATWIGAWISHSQNIKASAEKSYITYLENQKIMEAFYESENLGEYQRPARVLEGGPKAGVQWCIPLLPGIALVHSSYVIGPLWGKGSAKVVFWYIFDSKVLVEFGGWIS